MANYTPANLMDVFPPAVHREILRQAGLPSVPKNLDENKKPSYAVVLKVIRGDPPEEQVAWAEKGIKTMFDANMRVLKAFTEKFPGFNQEDFYQRASSENRRHKGIPCSWFMNPAGGIVFELFDITGKCDQYLCAVCVI
ncbi:hypothetical protein N7454_007514 [Penicillium verhagenii]|nr:hypothetical protein N7454_007514 [Penicillium verhagenii]